MSMNGVTSESDLNFNASHISPHVKGKSDEGGDEDMRRSIIDQRVSLMVQYLGTHSHDFNEQGGSLTSAIRANTDHIQCIASSNAFFC